MTIIELSDNEAEKYKLYCKFQSQFEALLPAWKQVIDFSKQLGSGTFFVKVQNGLPMMIEQPVKKIVIGIKI